MILKGSVLKQCTSNEVKQLHTLIHEVIQSCYPKIYPPAVVRFYERYHSIEELKKRIAQSRFFILCKENKAIASAYLKGEEMGGVYVLPEFQHQGLGSFMTTHVIEEAKNLGTQYLWLEATPLAYRMYMKLGFEVKRLEVMYAGEHGTLDYYYMEQALKD